MFDKLKQLSKETLIYGVSTVVGRFLNFILVPFYTNIFLPDEFGVYTNIYAFLAIMNIIYIYGLEAAYLKMATLPELKGKKTAFSTAFISILSTSALFSLLLFLLQDTTAVILDVPTYDKYIFYVIAILFLDALGVLPYIYLRLQNKAARFSGIRVMQILVNISMNLILILGFGWGIEAIFLANTAASLFALLALSPDIFRTFALRFDLRLYKRLLKFGLPFFVGGFAIMLIQAIDKPIVLHLTDLETLGIYGANYKMGIFMMLYVQMFKFAWQPFFLQNAESKDAKELFSKVLTYFALAGSVVLVVLSLFIDNIIKFEIFGKTLIGSEYWSGIDIIPIILLAFLLNGFYVNFSAGLYIKEKSLPFPIIMGIGAAVCIGSNFLLVPLFGITGAALSTLLAYLIISLAFYFVTQRIYRINYEKTKIFGIFASLFITGLLYYYLRDPGQLTLLIKFALAAGFIILLLLFKVVGKQEYNTIKRRLSK